jgi:hypothetical protein
MSCISTLEDLLLSLIPVFTSPSADLFRALVVGWTLCPTRRTVTALIPFADPDLAHAHDAFHRFFRAGAWTVTHLFRLWAILLVNALAPTDPELLLATDDTVHKKTGRKVAGAKWQRDAVRSTGRRTVHVWGLQVAVLTLRVKPPWGGEPLALPLNIRLYRAGGPTLLDLVAGMIREVAGWFPDRRFLLVADGFYAPLAGRTLPRTHLVSRIRSDAALYTLPEPRRKGQRGRPRKKGWRLPDPKTHASRARDWRPIQTEERGQTRPRLVSVRDVLWYAVRPESPVLLVISRDPERKEKDDYFLTTDLSRKPEAVISAFADRWAIEDTFRAVKQSLGAEEPQTWQGQGPERVAAFAYFLYGLVWLWYIRHGYGSVGVPATPWYPSKCRPSFRDALAALRTALWRNRFSATVPHGAHLEKFTAPLVEALARAA